MGLYAKYLVCYDIIDNKRRLKLFNALKDLGLIPIQKSVFYGDLKPAEVATLSRLITQFATSNDDHCIWLQCQLTPKEITTFPGYKDWNYTEPDGHGFI